MKINQRKGGVYLLCSEGLSGFYFEVDLTEIPFNGIDLLFGKVIFGFVE